MIFPSGIAAFFISPVGFGHRLGCPLSVVELYPYVRFEEVLLSLHTNWIWPTKFRSWEGHILKLVTAEPLHMSFHLSI